MLKVGVTGGIGSGKSLVCRVFSVLGVPVYNADAAARRLMDSKKEIKVLLNDKFGRSVFSNGNIDRHALARIVFNDRSALDYLNSIIHPYVKKDFCQWLDYCGNVPYVVKEAAILIETGSFNELDTVILLVAPEETRIRRVMARDGLAQKSIEKRMASQWPDERKAEHAQLILRNDDSDQLLPVIIELHNQFSRGISAKKTGKENI